MNNITIRNARIIYRNLSGKPNQYNPEGRRSFSVVIDDENFAEELRNDGWNVKPLKKRDDDDPQRYHLPVAVVYGAYPPTIRMISQNSGTILNESTINMLDWADIDHCDIIIRPRTYEVRGITGVKAYVKSMNVYINEDELAQEFNDKFGDPIVEDDDTPF